MNSANFFCAVAIYPPKFRGNPAKKTKTQGAGRLHYSPEPSVRGVPRLRLALALCRCGRILVEAGWDADGVR